MQPATLSTVALRVHHLDAMVSFYAEAFGTTFQEVETSGIRSQFGNVGGVTLKLVPIRQAADFDGFPLHQLGFVVTDVDDVIALTLKYGGQRMEDAVLENGKTIHAAVRDPDGNTLELYAAS